MGSDQGPGPVTTTTGWVMPSAPWVDESVLKERSERLREVAEKYRSPDPEQVQTLRKRTKSGYVDLRYTSHATITRILNEIDPLWTFEFVSDSDGVPITIEKNGMLTAFGHLTLLGKRIFGVGSVESDKADWAKELYGDCLVAGTRITTKRGSVPIEDVVVGDWVANRHGWFPVVDHWLSSPQAPVVRVTFEDGRVLVGTPHHRVPTARGDVKLGDLVEGDELWEVRASSSTVGDTHVTQTPSVDSIGFITDGRWDGTGRSDICIETSGSSTTVLCRTDITSITSTSTPSTTTRPTWSRSLRRIISPFMRTPWSGTPDDAIGAGSSTSSHGTGHGSAMSTASKRNDMPRARSNLPRGRNRNSSSVSAAGLSSTPISHGPGSVSDPAGSATDLLRGLVQSARVNAVDRGSQVDLTPASATGAAGTCRVLRVEDAGIGTVFNLSVGLVHEYSANGLAVSNCLRNTAMRAGIHLALWSKDFPEAEQQKKTAGLKESLAKAKEEPVSDLLPPLSEVVAPAEQDLLKKATGLVKEELGGTLATPLCGTQPERFTQWDAVPGCGNQVEEVDDRVVRITKTYLCNECLGKWRASTGAKEG